MIARRLRAFAVAAVAAVVTAAGASVVADAHPLHETPGVGEVTIYEPKYAWTGEAAGASVQVAHGLGGRQLLDECNPRVCDEFLLTVGPGARTLEVAVEASGGKLEVQIHDEAGREVFYSPGAANAPTVWRVEDPAPGRYLIEVLTGALAPAPLGDAAYTAFARLNDGIATPRPSEPEPAG